MENPYDFIRMELWSRRDQFKSSGIGKVYVGFCPNGDKYVTFDEREDIPIFAGGDLVGAPGNLEEETYMWQRQMYKEDLEGATIEELTEQQYKVLNDKRLYKFIKQV